MQEPFPDELETPYGLVSFRLILGLPPWAVALLGACCGGPIWFWGWRKWWTGVLGLALGALIAKAAADDPQFVSAEVGEFQLLDYYD